MLKISAEDIMAIGKIKAMLLNCATEKEVDGIFTQFSITDFSVKTILLRQAMQVQEVYDVPSEKTFSKEDIYKEELDFFLGGKWRELI